VPDFQRPPTTQEVVLAALRRAIQEGELLPGTIIKPDDVAARFGVSRVPVRESLKMLEGQGLVEHSAHAGYRVPLLTVSDAVEIYAIRALLETEALNLGLRRATEQDLAAATYAYEAAGAALAADNPNAYSEHSNAFHAALFAPCAMPRLMRMIATIWESTETYRPARALSADKRAELHKEHLAILDAYRARDRAAVIEASDAHRAHLLDVVLEIMPG
jgi:DNA-binding GntR family transcriptional regulator